MMRNFMLLNFIHITSLVLMQFQHASFLPHVIVHHLFDWCTHDTTPKLCFSSWLVRPGMLSEYAFFQWIVCMWSAAFDRTCSFVSPSGSACTFACIHESSSSCINMVMLLLHVRWHMCCSCVNCFCVPAAYQYACFCVFVITCLLSRAFWFAFMFVSRIEFVWLTYICVCVWAIAFSHLHIRTQRTKDRRLDDQLNRQTDRLTSRKKNIRTDSQANRQTHSWTDGRSDG